ncbi:MAG TPA: NAD(P)/FAD-dependent oxidoreductase [Candidatus Binataceae bacterium]|nr:NAD(P)/FAD-dependent oxidoreductase [Candidatus Binataceae bacterium]
MPDSTFDAIIIGAGHNGMALATYLAKAGWSVGVFEQRTEEGGALCTEELTRPGFLHNVHANYHTLVGICPVYDDLELVTRHGLRYVHPPVQMASVFNDGTALVVHTDLDKTCESIARFSKKDADTFRAVYEEARGYRDLILRTMMYSPPPSIRDITKALVTWGVEEKSKFLSVHLRHQTINEFLERHFENDHVKAHLAFHAALAGYATDRRGLAVSFPLLLSKIDNWHVCIGGSHALAHSIWEALAQAGGRVFLDHGVEKILVENGKAVGVRLQDGSEVRARKVVASSVSLEQTFLRFIGKENLPAPLTAEVEHYQHMDWTFFSVHLAMAAKPDYRAAAFDPDVNRAWVLNVGYESPAQFNQDWRDVRAGKLLPPRPNAAVNSLYDPTDAPPGFYTGLLRQIAPFNIAEGGSATWDKVAREYGQRCVDVWTAAAPNLRNGGILEWATYSPLDITRRMTNMVQGDWMGGLIDLDNMLDKRPGPVLSDYRTPIGNLYMCGATQHPHGFVTFAPAYNALEMIAQDQKVDRWWK